MIITFQILLLFIIFVSFVMMFDKESSKQVHENYMFICAIAIACFIASGVWL